MDLKLKDRVVLITGAGQGVGRAGVTRFLEENAIVYAADVNREQLARLQQEYPADRLKTLYFDVTDEKCVASGVERIVAAEGRLDVLFHNAMNAKYVNNCDKPITELPEEVWINIRTLVLDGTFHCVKYVGQAMERQKRGSIVLTSTVDALIACPGISAYVTAKGGVVALVRAAATSLSPRGVRINSIAPGFVKTPAQMSFIDDPQIRKLHLMDVADPLEVADIAVFLASDVSRLITGTTISADSGYGCFKGDIATFNQTVATPD